MSNAKEYVKTLTVSDLFNNENKCKYIIPIYQRNYAITPSPIIAP